MIIIGIDPGITGAVAVIIPGRKSQVFDTPVQTVKAGKSKKQDYLPGQMARMLEPYAVGSHCFIERVGAMPGQGVTSMFNFGKGYGMWLGILAALGVPCTLVTPQAWKKVMMSGLGDKDAARGRAQQVFPHLVDELSQKKDIGRADALLIAKYGEGVAEPDFMS